MLNENLRLVLSRALARMVIERTLTLLPNITRGNPVDLEYLTSKINASITAPYNEGDTLGIAVDRLIDVHYERPTEDGYRIPEEAEALNLIDGVDSEDPVSKIIDTVAWKLAQILSAGYTILTDSVTKTVDTMVEAIGRRLDNGPDSPVAQYNFDVVSWGVLDDASALSSILAVCRDKVNLFQSGEKIQPFYADTCFSRATNFVNSGISALDHPEITDTLSSALSTFNGTEHEDAVATLPNLLMNGWATRGMFDAIMYETATALRSVDTAMRLSSLYLALIHLTTTTDPSQSDMHDAIHSNSSALLDGVSLVLGGIYAKRAVNYGKSLVLGERADSKTVVVSAPLLKIFVAAGQELDDVARWMFYCDQKGIFMPPEGWELEYITDRKAVFEEVAMMLQRIQEEQSVDDLVFTRDVISGEIARWLEMYNASQAGREVLDSPERRTAIAQMAGAEATSNGGSLPATIISIVVQAYDSRALSMIVQCINGLSADRDIDDGLSPQDYTDALAAAALTCIAPE